ncbi:MAG: hypothetical protein JWP91_3892 [Fibrobacteres bacterium]|nr:hypothetical protein [Fibrobacterota bacterium]
MTRIRSGNDCLALLSACLLGLGSPAMADGSDVKAKADPVAAPGSDGAEAAVAWKTDSAAADLPSGDVLESKVRSTLLFGGSSPVSFSGEARLRISEHDFSEYPNYLIRDQTWTQADYEGNESMLRLAMVVRAGRNAVLWSKLGFQNTLPGIFLNKEAADGSGFTRAQNRHDKSEVTANIHEDMAAGLAIRTVPASFWVRMGNVLWTEASPLTIWKAQPRTFAWDYLPYEVEQPVGRYYEYNIAKGEKSGRAAWNKKPFNGVDLRSIDLPAGLQLALLWGTFERYDNFEREFVDFSSDLALADLANDAKQQGIGDSFRHMYHARLAKEKALGGLTLGINTVGIRYKSEIALNQAWRNNFSVREALIADTANNRQLRFLNGQGFYKQPKVWSMDLKGAVNENLDVHFDLALGLLDTVWMRYSVDSAGTDSLGHKSYNGIASSRTASADPVPAAFARIRSRYGIPVQADIAYIPKGFYSPFSFATPVDAFFPVGSNMVGAGKFIGRGEGSPYSQNMAGLNLSVSPNVGYGHFRVGYGQHFQPSVARDVLYFPYRLNGQDFNSVFQTSYNRWGNNLVDHSLTTGKYPRRLGDESFRTPEYQNPYGPEAGGLRSDYLSIYEGFVPYDNAAQADSNLTHPTGILTRSPFVPEHRKWAFNFELDGAADIGPRIGYAHDLFLSGYFALNGVSSRFRPLAFSPADLMLWGTYFRAEPAIALTDKFYLLGLAGFENWRSDQAYMEDPASGAVVRVPIAYRDYAYGGGFDWDFASRTGLHGRYKWMKHTDEFFSANDWTNALVSAEIKMWF